MSSVHNAETLRRAFNSAPYTTGINARTYLTASAVDAQGHSGVAVNALGIVGAAGPNDRMNEPARLLFAGWNDRAWATSLAQLLRAGRWTDRKHGNRPDLVKDRTLSLRTEPR